MDTNSFSIYIKIEDIYEDITVKVEKRVEISNYNCLFNNEPILKLQQRFKSETHNVFTERVNKIALNSNDDKRMETFDRITS